MRELLKELEEILMESSNYTKENRSYALSKIREELLRPVEPVLLSDSYLMITAGSYSESVDGLPINLDSDEYSLALGLFRAIEQAVLKANGLGGDE